MPKLWRTRESVSAPFSWPMTTMLRPRKRPMPPTMARSSAKLPVGVRLELRDFIGDIEIAAVGEVPQRLDLALQLGDRLFEIEEMAHCGALRRTGTGARPL